MCVLEIAPLCSRQARDDLGVPLAAGYVLRVLADELCLGYGGLAFVEHFCSFH